MLFEDLNTAQALAARKVVAKCIESRVYFIKEILGAEPEKWQAETLYVLDSGTNKISIRSGHGVGKTTLCAWLALHFLLFRDDVKIIVTAPSADQMKDGLIPEINKWISKLPNWIQSSLEILTDRISRKPNVTNNFISFRTARKEKPEALAGVHADHVMIIVDEASGVDEVIYETGQGALSTEGSIALLIGNPTNPSGFFYKTHHELSDIWYNRKVSCYDSTRVSPTYIQTQLRTYGADSREFRVRVLGEFPESGQMAVIPRSFAESAINRYASDLGKHSVVWGLDPGAGGDPTGFIERDMNIIADAQELHYENTMEVVGWIANRYKMTPDIFKPHTIYVDTIGIGAGVADRLAELNLPVYHVNVSESPAEKDRFQNLRAEIWFAVRDWLETREVSINCALAAKLVDELVSVNMKFTSSGKTLLESKDELKRRGLKSPNLADALALTFSDGAQERLGNYDKTRLNFDLSNYKVPGLA